MSLLPADLGKTIGLHIDTIRKQWLDKVNEQIEVSRDLSEEALVDDLFQFVLEISGELEKAPTSKPGSAVLQAARAHGSSRANANYDVQNVALEYSLLRQVVLQVASEQGHLTKDSIFAFNRINDLALMNAVEEYLKNTVISLDRSKQEVQHERKSFQNHFDQIPEIVHIYKGPKHELEFANKASREIFKEDIFNIDLQTSSGEPIEIDSLMDEAYQTGTLRTVEEVPVENENRTKYFNFTFSPRKDLNSQTIGLTMMGTEVTSQVFQQKALKLQSQALELSMTEAPLTEVLELMTEFIELQAENTLIASILLTDKSQSHLKHGAAPNLPKEYNEAIDGIAIGDNTGSCGTAAFLKKPVMVTDIANDPKWAEFKDLALKHNLRACWSVPILSSKKELLGTFAFYSNVVRKPSKGEIGIVKVAAQTTALIIERRQEIEDKKIAADEARRANTAKSAFLANMSHEIRTPLGAVMGFSDLARQPEAKAEDVKAYLDIVERNSVQVLRIIDDILDLAKVEAGRVELENMEFSFTNFLADFGSLFGFRARENGISFQIIAETDLPKRVKTDPTRLRQILTNAVGNAIKFTRQGSVTLHVCLDGDTLQFGIADTGRGITEEQADKLFKAFSQADVSTTRKFGGTGLGLVLTKHLCQIMGGDYILEKSELGVGSKFEATVKVEIPKSSDFIPQKEVVFSVDKKESRESAKAQLEGTSVLMVEDSPENQLLVRLILEQQGANLEIAENGKIGVEKALANDYDVVLMDIQMPVMDGHQAVQTLREKNYAVPIVALTAHAMKEEVLRTRESGFTTFLSKPIKRKALVALISILTDKKMLDQYEFDH